MAVVEKEFWRYETIIIPYAVSFSYLCFGSAVYHTCSHRHIAYFATDCRGDRAAGAETVASDGAVDFSVPLYTIELDRYTLPLSLNYRTNGIKFYDDPE